MASARVVARRLIVNADDFGVSHSVNQAVARAHRQGILTTASLMVNGAACREAVQLARENPKLGVGLHLTLACGLAALAPSEIPDLANPSGCFSGDPVRAGFRYFFQRRLRPQLEREIDAQFRRFQATGLPLDHVNGHLHFHLHPTILDILLRNADRWRITCMRLTWDPFGLNLRLASGRWMYRSCHSAAFFLLARRARPKLAGRGIRHTGAVFGLLQDKRVDETYLAGLLPQLPAGDSELYSHPSLDEFRHELDALISERIKRLAQDHAIQLIRYQDL
ncbi:MAG: hopanoid biosynthesis-associated protein HpnK [Chloroflexi bacterium]|nr:hopanoid biosynthesis-associated protein HpnK [Chloroflexota bacterium]